MLGSETFHQSVMEWEPVCILSELQKLHHVRITGLVRNANAIRITSFLDIHALKYLLTTIG